MYIKLQEFTFSSDFESGNLSKVLPVNLTGSISDTSVASNVAKCLPFKGGKSCNFNEDLSSVHHEFNLWTRPDCAGTPFENNNRTWFYFSIAGGIKGQRARLVMMNLNKQYKLFSQGMLPVVQYENENGSRTKWERIKEKCFYKSEEGSTIISWIHNVTSETKACYFAFTYPYTYSELDIHLAKCFSKALKFPNIYFHRELLVKSLDGNRLDLLTISSDIGMLPEREDAIPGLFLSSEMPRAFRFKGKKVIFLSARVHPGETSSSFVMSGFLNFILSDDPRAARLREVNVFKLIPMLNPDGVIRGHYRTDQRGVNLNRVYVSPTLEAHPTIYATRQIILYHHYNMNIQLLLDNEHQLDEFSNQKADIRMPLIDEDTCHSFSDAARKNIGVGTTTPNQKTLDVDELSASCWDVSSNVSSDNYPPAGPAVQAMDVSEMHDDCSNISGISETETGVTNMFRSLSPNKFDQSSFCFQTKKSYNSFPTNSPARETGSQALSRVYSTAEVGSPTSAPYYFGKRENLPIRSPQKLTSTPKLKKYSSFVNRKNQGDGTAPVVVWQPDYSPLNYNEVKPDEDAESGLFLYVDLHGHASKRGIFIYGNWFEDAEMMVENMLFPKILSLNCPNFDFTACNFSERNMYTKDKKDGMSKEGSGRVAVMRATGILRSYTLECNYNSGRTCNQIQPLFLKLKKPSLVSTSVPKYTPALFEDCGRQLGVSLLDLLESHAWSRIPYSPFSNLSGIRSNLHCLLASSGRSAKSQSVPTPTTPHSRYPPKLALDEPIEPGTSMSYEPQMVKNIPRMGRMRTRVKRNSWAFSVDAENREPTAQQQSSGMKASGMHARTTHLTKKNVSRSLTFAEEGEVFALKPTTVPLTPQMSVGDVEPSKVVKKLNKPRRTRQKLIVKKKIKMSNCSSETSAIEFALHGIDSSTPLSPRSPLASVCEPQSSQSSSPALLVNLVQPKSPVGLITTLPAESPLRIGKVHKRTKKSDSEFQTLNTMVEWPAKESKEISKPKVRRRRKTRGRKPL